VLIILTNKKAEVIADLGCCLSNYFFFAGTAVGFAAGLAIGFAADLTPDFCIEITPRKIAHHQVVMWKESYALYLKAQYADKNNSYANCRTPAVQN